MNSSDVREYTNVTGEGAAHGNSRQGNPTRSTIFSPHTVEEMCGTYPRVLFKKWFSRILTISL